MSNPLHLADHTPAPALLVCLACGSQFLGRQAAADPWGDPCCPHCGSLRLDHAPQRGERARRFLLHYNQL